MPNVLKVYLENGQTKAFRFETSTTVKDIVLTLKEKLSIRSIAHFALALEEQYNIAKIYLLHDDELIEQVVQKRESHDYRCLFRVCFIPKDPLDLLQEDPVAFEYLYLQSCSDVLQERFAVEMKCSVALRLAALHIQERIYACAQPQKVSLKYIEKDWGIENFISPTLLRNMRGKDIKKAISYHMKRNQVLLDPRQKHMLAAVQVRLSYLQILGDLKMYNGKIFNATLMLQDRESYVALLVGAKYGVSQIINNKLNIITSLAEFANISRLELTEESEKVSMVKIYLQDLKLLTLLLESNSAKDLVCLISGYYRLFVDANVSIFTWGESKQQLHRMSAEEGYESRTCSDSEDSWELDSSSEHCLDPPAPYGSVNPVCKEEELEDLHSLEQDSIKPQAGEREQCNKSDNTMDSTSEASDSANTESQGCKTSGSSDSMDALEEDELEACSSSRPEFFHFYTPTVQEMNHPDKSFFPVGAARYLSRTEAGDFYFLQVPQAAEPGSEHSHSEQRREDMGASVLENKLSERNAMGYYSLCYSISPAGSVERNISHSPRRSSWKDMSAPQGVPCRSDQMAEVSDLILDPPPGFGDTSSEDEFYDAADRLSPQGALAAGCSLASWDSIDDVSCILKKPRCYSSGENLVSRQTTKEKHRIEKELTYAKSLRKRRSFLKTDYTSQVTFPLTLPGSQQSCCSSSLYPSFLTELPDQPSSENIKMDTEVGVHIDTKAQRDTTGKNSSADLMEMEPDTMETKTVTNGVFSSISAVCLQGDQNGQESSDVAVCVDNGLSSAGHTPFLLGEETGHLPREQSRSTKKDPSIELKTGWQHEDTCETSRDQSAQVVLKGAPEMMEAHCKVNNEAKFQSKEMSCPCNECTVSPLAYGTTMTSSCDETLDFPLPAAGKEAACGELVLASCEESKADFDNCAEKQSDIGLSQVKNRPAVSEEAFWKAHSKNHVCFPNVTQLLTSCSGNSGVITHLSWLSFGVRADLTSPSLSREKVDNPLELLDSQETVHMTSGCLGADVVRKEMQTHSAGSAFEKELVSNQASDGEPRKDKENVDYRQPQPSQALIPREEATALEKDCPLIPSLGLPFPSGPVALGSLEKRVGEHRASNHSFLCFNYKDEQTPPSHITDRSLGLSTMKNTFPPQFGMDKCNCQLSYVSCFHRPEEEEEHENTIPMHSMSLEPLTTPPSTIHSLPGTPVDRHPVATARDRAWLDPHIQALTKLKDQAQMSPADFSCFLAYIAELQEVVGKLSGNRTTHLQDRCAEHSSESKGALGSASRDLLSNCQELLKTERPLNELQGALRLTFDDLVQLTVACFQVTHCQLCIQRQSELVSMLADVVGTYHQLVQVVHQLLYRQKCQDVGAKLLARQHTALTAAVFCLMQQFRVPSSL
ncbi:FERM and PDZ domain-containing protein 1 isoform X2 [Rhea pennata]